MRLPIFLMLALVFKHGNHATSSKSKPAYNVLFMAPMASRSHQNVIDPVAEELARRGHQVTMMSPNKAAKVRAVQDIHLSIVDKFIQENLKMFNFFQALPTDRTFLTNLIRIGCDVANATYSEPEVTKLFRTPDAFKYDVMIVDGVFNEFVLPLAHHMGLPTVLIAPANKHPFHSWKLNIPHPYAYIPMGVELVHSPMTFLERTKNAILSLLFLVVRDIFLLGEQDALVKNFIPNSPPISELERKVSFLMSNSHPSIQPSIPSMPYFEEVGCLNCVEAKPLSKELEDYMQSSGDDGLIYFAIGSITKGDDMPAEMREKLIKAFAQLQQKILWKYESNIVDLPKNIKLVKWAPQQDILAHNKTRLFITHGGGLSTLEAIYHKCPIIGFPLSADQLGNMGNAVQQGFAECLDWKTFTIEELLSKIHLMLDNNRYQERVNYLSDLLHDRPQSPLETAAYWIEYVIRHKGAPHLRSQAENLNFFQYFLLDVIGVVVAVLIAVIVAACFVVRLLCRMVFRKWCKTTKTNVQLSKSKKAKKQN